MNCECGKELTEKELTAIHNVRLKNKICDECMNDYVHHVVTGE